MAIPLLAPLAPFVPVLKVVGLGSIKFIALGIGASIMPVHTANILVGMSSSTPLKLAEFRFKRGYLSTEEIENTRKVFEMLNQSITNKDKFLSRSESRDFLFSLMKETWQSMKQNILSLPSKIAALLKSTGAWIAGLVRSFKNKSNQ